jgi:hypothetical protein
MGLLQQLQLWSRELKHKLSPFVVPDLVCHHARCTTEFSVRTSLEKATYGSVEPKIPLT